MSFFLAQAIVKLVNVNMSCLYNSSEMKRQFNFFMIYAKKIKQMIDTFTGVAHE